jgi:hypothetical protein
MFTLDVRAQDFNARSTPKAMFERLAQTITATTAWTACRCAPRRSAGSKYFQAITGPGLRRPPGSLKYSRSWT